MYDVIKIVIDAGGYSLSDVLAKIEREWVLGHLTDEERDQLIEAAMNQNFVPVVDDRGMFIGIVRRQAIIRYCYDRSRAAAAEQRRKPEKQEKRVPVSAGVQ